jgi:glycine/D-amino acid oxidase-like deaminating enzyme
MMARSSTGRVSYDFAVIGGGAVGAAIAYGLATRGLRVAVLDEGDRSLRAARTNFGLVWLQTKGIGFPPYVHWTRLAIDAWPEFSRSIQELTGVNIEYRKDGGLIYCLGAAEFEARRGGIEQMRSQSDVNDTQLLERSALERLLPGARLGEAVTGASFCPHDGHCNPLLLLRALHAAMTRSGANYFPDSPAKAVRRLGNAFLIEAAGMRIEAAKVVLAAGHGNTALAPALGLRAPITAQRGQILVTERLRPVLALPGSGLRQTADGTVMIGVSKEDSGLDDGTTADAGAKMATRALRILPDLARARLVRTWGGIRVLTPDHAPVYDESRTCPGAFIATCHSGITLAAAHATALVDMLVAGKLGASLQPFSAARFGEQASSAQPALAA